MNKIKMRTARMHEKGKPLRIYGSGSTWRNSRCLDFKTVAQSGYPGTASLFPARLKTHSQAEYYA